MSNEKNETQDARLVNPYEDRDGCFERTCFKRGEVAGYMKGYVEALSDYGIWKDGVQRIGCLETPIKEIIKRKFG